MGILRINVLVIFLVDCKLEIYWSIQKFYFRIRVEIAKNESLFRLENSVFDYKMTYLYFSRLNYI